jgi:hypothetical protein
MYSFPGANHNLRRKRVRERTKLYNISTIVLGFSLCLAQQAQAGTISISNRNCAWQGFSRTNQAKFHLRGVWGVIKKTPENVTWSVDCSSDWITLHVGGTQTLQVAAWLNFDDVASMQCKYAVEAEGAAISTQYVLGEDFSKYVCEQDWFGICQCRIE